MTELADPTVAITIMEKFASLGVLIGGIEYLTSPRQLSDDGLLSWRIGSLRRPWLTGPPWGKVFDAIFRYPNVLITVSLYTAFAAAVLLAPPAYTGRLELIAPLTACLAVLFLRNNYGYDGADQLIWLIFAGLIPVAMIGTGETKATYLWFIAIQLSLAYGVAGIAKASAKGWRDGSFLVGILGTRIYGNAKLARFVSSRPRLATLHCRLIIAFECSFLIILVLPRSVVVLWLLIGIAFHIANAYVMGLNTFVWAFVAGYPAIIFCILTRGW